MERLILYIDMDKVTAGQDADYNDGKYKAPGFFAGLKPIDGAIESIKYLHSTGRYDIYFLSSPSWDVPESYTAKRVWLENNLGEIAYKKLILTHNKSLNKGDYLIDDYGKNGVGFNGDFIHFKKGIFQDWPEVVKYLDNDYEKKANMAISLSGTQQEIKSYLIDLYKSEIIKSKIEAINKALEKFPNASLDDINRAWLTLDPKQISDEDVNSAQSERIKEIIK